MTSPLSIVAVDTTDDNVVEGVSLQWELHRLGLAVCTADTGAEVTGAVSGHVNSTDVMSPDKGKVF